MKFLIHALVRVFIPVGILAAGGYGFTVLSVDPEQEQSEPAEKQVLRSHVSSLNACDFAVKIETHGVVGPVRSSMQAICCWRLTIATIKPL